MTLTFPRLWPLVRESMANPCMDFQKSMDINMDIHDFWITVFNYPYKLGYPHWYPSTDIHARTFCNGYPYTINIHKLISMFLWICLQLSMLLWICLWISLDFYGYPCIDLLWILDPGTATKKSFSQGLQRNSWAERRAEQGKFIKLKVKLDALCLTPLSLRSAWWR